MKTRYLLLGFLLAGLVVMCAAVDMRNFDAKHPVATYSIDQQSWASGVTTADTDTLTFTGRCEQIETVVSNATNGITFTVAITTADGGTLFSEAAIPENATTITKLTDAATDVGTFWANGTTTVTLTPSGDPGASGVTCDVTVYVE